MKVTLFLHLLGDKMKFVQPIRDIHKIEEIKKILESKSKRDRMLFSFGINSGLRISDILPLQVKDVKNKTHVIVHEKKTNKDKRFILLITLRQEIERYIEGMKDEDYLFRSRKSRKPITRVQAYRILNDVAKEVGLEEIGTHTMRKTFGFWFYQRTKDVAALQELFNHSSPSITLKYIGINADVLDMKMEEFGGL